MLFMHSMQAFIVNSHYKNNHTDNVNGVTFVTRKYISPEGPIFDNLSCTWEFSFVFHVISLEVPLNLWWIERCSTVQRNG